MNTQITTQKLNSEEKMKTMAALTKEQIDLRKVFIDHVPCEVTNEDIEIEFSKHGPLLEVAKYQDRKDPRRHYAFVTFKNPQDCAKATSNPEPLIRGKKVECWLAAIGSNYSGFKFFCEMGVLTPKAQTVSNNGNNGNNVANGNSGGVRVRRNISTKSFQRTIPSNNHYQYRSQKTRSQNRMAPANEVHGYGHTTKCYPDSSQASQWHSYETSATSVSGHPPQVPLSMPVNRGVAYQVPQHVQYDQQALLQAQAQAQVQARGGMRPMMPPYLKKYHSAPHLYPQAMTAPPQVVYVNGVAMQPARPMAAGYGIPCRAVRVPVAQQVSTAVPGVQRGATSMPMRSGAGMTQYYVAPGVAQVQQQQQQQQLQLQQQRYFAMQKMQQAQAQAAMQHNYQLQQSYMRQKAQGQQFYVEQQQQQQVQQMVLSQEQSHVSRTPRSSSNSHNSNSLTNSHSSDLDSILSDLPDLTRIRMPCIDDIDISDYLSDIPDLPELGDL